MEQIKISEVDKGAVELILEKTYHGHFMDSYRYTYTADFSFKWAPITSKCKNPENPFQNIMQQKLPS